MTDAQMQALIRVWANGSTRKIIKLFYATELRPVSNDLPSILHILYLDNGGNYHSIGILPDGKCRTYE